MILEVANVLPSTLVIIDVKFRTFKGQLGHAHNKALVPTSVHESFSYFIKGAYVSTFKKLIIKLKSFIKLKKVENRFF